MNTKNESMMERLCVSGSTPGWMKYRVMGDGYLAVNDGMMGGFDIDLV